MARVPAYRVQLRGTLRKIRYKCQIGVVPPSIGQSPRPRPPDSLGIDFCVKDSGQANNTLSRCSFSGDLVPESTDIPFRLTGQGILYKLMELILTREVRHASNISIRRNKKNFANLLMGRSGHAFLPHYDYTTTSVSDLVADPAAASSTETIELQIPHKKIAAVAFPGINFVPRATQ